MAKKSLAVITWLCNILLAVGTWSCQLRVYELRLIYQAYSTGQCKLNVWGTIRTGFLLRLLRVSSNRIPYRCWAKPHTDSGNSRYLAGRTRSMRRSPYLYYETYPYLIFRFSFTEYYPCTSRPVDHTSKLQYFKPIDHRYFIYHSCLMHQTRVPLAIRPVSFLTSGLVGHLG